MIGSILTSSKHQAKGNPTTSFVLQSPDTSKWVITINSNGVLVAHSGAAGVVSDIKVTGGSVSESSFSITNDGEIQTRNDGDLSGTATLDDNFRIRSEGGTIYKLKVNVSDEIELESV